MGIKLATTKPHLFYKDNLKLYGKDDNEFKCLLHTIKAFSDDIGIEVVSIRVPRSLSRKGN